MSSNALEKIITKKTEKIEKLKKTISSESLNDLINANNTFVDFKEKIEENINNNEFSIMDKQISIVNDLPLVMYCTQLNEFKVY